MKAGIVGLPNVGKSTLFNIRETDAIIHVLRCFDNDNITHVDGSVDPIRDKEIIDIELQLKDLESLNNRLEKVSRTVKSGDKEAAKEKEVLNQAISFIESSNNIRSIDLDEDDINKYLMPLQLITSKPVLYVCNVDEGSITSSNSYVESVKSLISEEGANLIVLAAGIESEINELEDYEERRMFLDDLGLDEPGSSKLISATYDLLNLHTYFTAGPKEVRAWTIPKMATVILFKSSANFEEYNFVRFSLSPEFSNCLALIKSKVFLFSRISPPIFFPNFSSSP